MICDVIIVITITAKLLNGLFYADIIPFNFSSKADVGMWKRVMPITSSLPSKVREMLQI